MRRALIGIIVFVSALPEAPAQTPVLDITIHRRGRVILIDLLTRATPIREVLVQLGARLDVELRFLPGSPVIMEGQVVPVQVVEMPLADLVSHLAGAVGLEGRVEDGHIVVRPEPAEGSDEAKEWARLGALAARRNASLKGDPEHLWKIGLLHLAANEYGKAVGHFERFATVAKDDERAPRALLLAASCLLRSGDEPRGESYLQRIIQQYDGSNEVMEAWLLQVRLFMKRKEWSPVPPILARVMRKAPSSRLRALGSLVHAEFWYVQGKGKQASDALEGFTIDMRREFEDLGALAPLFEGMCLMLEGAHERALSRLQRCLLTPDRVVRVRAALALAQACIHLKRRIAALQNVQIALNEKPTGRHLVEARLMQAEIYTQLGLGQRAMEAYDQAAVACGAGDLTGVEFHILRETASILFARHAFDEAREIYRHLALRPDRMPWATVLLARCEIGLGRNREAITLLEKIPAAADGVDHDEIARLRGRCYMQLGDYAKAALAFGTRRNKTTDAGKTPDDGKSGQAPEEDG